MPGGDRTGPTGMGPMTGRAAGYCAGYPAPGFTNPMPGYGCRAWGGGGGGRGHRNWFYATGLTGRQRAAYGYPAYGAPHAVTFAPAMTGAQEADALRGQARHLEDALEGIRKRLEELEAKPSDR